MDPSRAAVVDWLVVLVVAAAATTGLGLERPWDGSTVEQVLVGLGLALPLAARRHRPVRVAGVVGALLVVQAAVGGALGFGAFLAAVVAAFSAGRHVGAPVRSALGALAVLLGALLATADALQVTPAEAVFPIVYLGAAWGLGRIVSAHEHRAVRLTRLNEALERDRRITEQLAVADERIRLARELHDVVAHTVMVMVWQAELAEELLEQGDPAGARASMGAVAASGRSGLADLRSLVGVLRDEPGEDGSTRGLDGIVALGELLSRSGLEVTTVVDLADDVRDRIPHEAESAVFRCVQEALTNVLRHSQATRATVTLSADRDELHCTVVDPGPVRPATAPGSGRGLDGMRERVAPLGGSIEALPYDGGFQVEARLPLRTVPGGLPA